MDGQAIQRTSRSAVKMQFWVIFSCVSNAYPLLEWNWLATTRIRTHKLWYFSTESEKALRFLLEKLVLTSMMHGYLQSSESSLPVLPASKTWKCHSVIGSDAGFWHWKGRSCSLTNCCTPCTFSATLCSYLHRLNFKYHSTCDHILFVIGELFSFNAFLELEKQHAL